MYEFDPFTPQDAEYVMRLLDGYGEGDTIAIDPNRVSYTSVVIPIEEFDLEMIESSLHGITDPIGQLKDWLYDRLQELASWFADTVGSIFEDFYNTIIKPVIDTIGSTIDSIWDYIKQIPEYGKGLLEWLEDSIKGAWDWIQEYIINPLTDAFNTLANTIDSLLSDVINFLTETLPDTIGDVVNQAWNWIQDNIVKPLTNAFNQLSNLISSALETVSDFLFETLPNSIGSILDQIRQVGSDIINWIQDNIVKPFSDAINSLLNMVSEGINSLVKFFTETLPQELGKLPDMISQFASQTWEWIQNNIVSPLSSAVQGIIDYISKGLEPITKFFTETLPDMISSTFKTLQDQVGNAWKWIQDNIVNPLSNAIGGLLDLVGKGIDTLTKFLSETLPENIRKIGDELMALPEKVLNSLQVAGLTLWKYITELGNTMGSWFEKATKMLDNVAKSLYQVGVYLTGFINSVSNLPQQLAEHFKPLIEASESIGNLFGNLWDQFQKFTQDPWKWLQENMFNPIMQGLQWIGSKLWEGLQWFGSQIQTGLETLWETLSKTTSVIITRLTETVIGIGKGLKNFFEDIMKKVLFEPIKAFTDQIGNIWFKVFTGESKGEVDLVFRIASEFLIEYWKSTLLIYAISSLPKGLGDIEIVIEPEAVGTKGGGIAWKPKISELLDCLVKGFRDFYPSFLTGTFVGIGTTLMRPVEYAYRLRFVSNYEEYVKEMYGDLLKDELEKGAIVNMFVETPGIREIKDWVRRQLVLTEGLQNKNLLNKIIATMRAHLKMYGLPKWYIDYLSDTGEKLIYEFEDRFGKPRTIYLSTLFELPTHSELARMTQRDVFPGVNVMKRLGWIRGWNEDLTTLIYLLTFKYPSFEKLWSFYMRSTAGLLWFKPPSMIKEIFDLEAEEVGAGKPIPPLDLQDKMETPEHLKAFELAINTYFKWLEYSNFSWFTQGTKLYEKPIGREIYQKLGGWTADSWIMADVAADIPSKIDLRWMSRYGIFIYMADRLEKAGIRFESYKPMVKAIPQLLDQSAQSPIGVNLKWFSKLLQGTGLHPAWVPIVTVAENIMAIADEMTLLRTGWLNLFKDGLLDVSKVDEYLNGLLIVSYEVGYWDVDTKEWRTGYINLPVRWLPHERRLLELRMAIDRVIDLYREIERHVLSGIRTLAISDKEAIKILEDAVALLNKHYEKLTNVITGKKMTIAFDEEYEKIRIKLFSMIQGIEVKERIRYWWYRISGWLLYRIAYGYVTTDDINAFLEGVSRIVPITDAEINAFRIIAESVLGIVRKEYIPTPSQLATLSEYLVIPKEVVEKAFEQRQIPEEWRSIWRKYIETKPLADDIKKVINNYYRAKRYKIVISQDVENQVKELMRIIGFTDREKRIRELGIMLEQMVSDASRYRQLFEPTYSFLATLLEYVDLYEIEGFKEFMDDFVKKLEKLGVNKSLLRAMIKYIHVRPVKSDYRSLLYYVIRAYVKGIVSKKVLDEYLNKATDYGFTKKELEILSKRVEFEEMIEESKEYLPTPSMLATMSEYIVIPDKLIDNVFEARRVPKEWRSIWRKYIETKPLADDVRYLLSVYISIKRHGITLPQDIEQSIKKIFDTYGVSKTELRIRELAIALDLMRESLPTLSQLGSMAEYIEIPEDFVKKVLEARKVPKDYAELWIKYISVRTIASEVNELVSQYRRIYEYFTVPREFADKVMAIMREGGWTDRELQVFNLALELRKAYRIMAYLVPSIRQAVYDAYYIPEWEKQLEDVLRARGIDITKYQKQIEYYKKLARNRLVWRQIAWYRNRLVYAYANGVITKDQLKQRLEKLKDYGLSDAEIELILDGAELEKQRIIKIYGPQ